MGLRIGTSGFQHPHWRGIVYSRDIPEREWLATYADEFDTVELNTPFDRLPTVRTLRAWHQDVPEGFTFAVKASRTIGDVRQPEEMTGAITRFIDRVRELGDALGPILVRLPPDAPAAPRRLEEALAAFPAAMRVALEPRHPSWFVPVIRRILRDHGAALCVSDRRGVITPVIRTADWAYVRLEEGRAKPGPCYGIRALRAWADRLDDLVPDDDMGYVFFGNDGYGCAVANARTLRRLSGADPRRRAIEMYPRAAQSS